MTYRILLTLLTAAAISAPAAAEPGTLYGMNAGMMNTQPLGLYKVPLSGNPEMVWADGLTYPDGVDNGSTSVSVLSAWQRNGHLCGIASYYPSFSGDYYKYIERDLHTGAVTAVSDIAISTLEPVDMTNFFLSAAYNPFDDRVYGFGLNAARNGYAFKSAPAGDLNDTAIIAELGTDRSKMCAAIAVDALNGNLYGFTWTNDFVRINPFTGEETKIFTPSIPAHEMRQFDAMTYWADTNEFILSFSDDTYSGGLQTTLYAVEPVRKTTRRLNYLGDQVVFNAIFEDSPALAWDPSAPAPCTLLAVGFDGESTVGTVSFTLPACDGNNEPLAGSLDWTLTIDGDPVKTGAASPGEAVAFEYDFARGTHIVSVSAASAGKPGCPAVTLATAGGQIPATPQVPVLSGSMLTWQPVTLSMTGNEISGVNYRISVNGEFALQTSECEADLTQWMPGNFPLTAYRASVQAVLGSNVSNAAVSNKVVIGKPMEMPVEVNADPWDFDLCTAYDADGNGSTWAIYGNSLLSGYGSEATEDWLFLPKTDLDGTYALKLTCTASAPESNMTGASLEAWMCTLPDPSAAKATLMEPRQIKGSDLVYAVSEEIVPDECAASEEFYVGICVRSEAGRLCPVLLRDIVLDASAVSADGPSRVVGLEAAPAPEGALKADISFTAPALRNDGTPLDAAQPIDFTVSSSVASCQAQALPGQKVSVEINTADGANTLNVTPKSGAAYGLSSSCTVYTGHDLPGYLDNLCATYDASNSQVTFRWDYPQEGWNGGYPSAGMATRLYARGLDEYGEMTYLPVTQTAPGETTLTLDTETTGTLANYEVGLAAVNDLGECPSLNTMVLQLGIPYALPMTGHFDGDCLMHSPFNVYTDKTFGGQTQFKWTRPVSIDPAYAADHEWAFTTSALKDNALSKIDFPKFSTSGLDKAGVHITLWNGRDAALTEVLLQAYPMFEPVSLGVSQPASAGYVTYHFDLPADCCGQPWALLSLLSSYRCEGDIQILTDYRIDDDASGVEGILTEGGVMPGRGCIRITGYGGRHIRIFAADGMAVVSATAEGDMTFDLAPGIYVVRIGSSLSLKTVVR